MAGLLYHLPGVQVLSPEVLRENGLPDGAVVDALSFHRGPAGEYGALFTLARGHAGARGPALIYSAERQEWKKASNERLWIGRETASPVSPADLLRREVIDGHEVELGDGQRWLVPVARAFPVGTRLPQSLVLGPGGQLVAETLPRYAEIWGDAERVWEQYVGELEAAAAGDPEAASVQKVTIADGWRIAVRALALNYLVGPEEVSFLRLFTTTNWQLVLQALIDVPTIAAKKKLDGSRSSGGDPGS